MPLAAAAPAIIQQMRATQIARSQAASRRIIRAYGDVYADINRQITDLQRQIAAAKAAGGDDAVNISWLYREQRLQTLKGQVAGAVGRFGDDANKLVDQLARDAATTGAHDANAAIQALLEQKLQDAGLERLSPDLLEAFSRLPTAAIEDAANNAFRYYRAGAAGGRIRTVASIFNELGPDAAKRMQNIIVSAVATGQAPEVTARILAKQMGIALNRALTVARTEQLSAWRRSNIATFRQNDDVLDGWTWLTGPDPCPFCAAQAGRLHKLDEDMATHPNCRCSASPHTKSLDDILSAYGLAA